MPDNIYPKPMRLMHWTMSVLILALLFVGFSMTNWWSKTSFTEDLYWYHKSFGVVVLLLFIGRVALRYHYRESVPIMAPTLPAWQRVLANVVHKALYLAIAVMVISGYLTSSFYTKTEGVPFFFGYLPQITPKNDAIEAICGEVHEIAAFVLLALLVLHVGGVIVHRFFDKPEHDSLKKMLP